MKDYTVVRPLSDIADEILEDWRKTNPKNYQTRFYAALPYVLAMLRLEKITDDYGNDSGDSIVRYALSNLTTWRGETARAVKKELKGMLLD